jgi:hypothetical protein
MTGNDILTQLALAADVVIAALTNSNSENHYRFYEGFNQWAEAAEIHLFVHPYPNSQLDTELSYLQKGRLEILAEILKVEEAAQKDGAKAIEALNAFVDALQKFTDKLDSSVLRTEISWASPIRVTD